MAAHYAPGAYDTRRDCYRYENKASQTAMCMQPQYKDAQIVNGRMYIQAVGLVAPTDTGLDPGTAALLVAEQSGNSWRPVLAKDGVDCGVRGDCSASDVKQVQLGTNVRGWMLTSGAMAAGGGSQAVAILAPWGNTIRELGSFETMSEADSRHTYDIHPDASAAAPVYPLLRLKINRKRVQVGKEHIPFNMRQGRYQSKHNLSKP